MSAATPCSWPGAGRGGRWRVADRENRPCTIPGAAHVIDYTQDDFADGARRYDLIIDIAGNPALSRLRRALTPAGTAVLTGGEDGGNVTGMAGSSTPWPCPPFLHQRLTMLTPGSAPATSNGSPSSSRPTATPSIGATYPLDQVPQAMRHLAAGQARGKVAITI